MLPLFCTTLIFLDFTNAKSVHEPLIKEIESYEELPRYKKIEINSTINNFATIIPQFHFEMAEWVVPMNTKPMYQDKFNKVLSIFMNNTHKIHRIISKSIQLVVLPLMLQQVPVLCMEMITEIIQDCGIEFETIIEGVIKRRHEYISTYLFYNLKNDYKISRFYLNKYHHYALDRENKIIIVMSAVSGYKKINSTHIIFGTCFYLERQSFQDIDLILWNDFVHQYGTFNSKNLSMFSDYALYQFIKSDNVSYI